MAADLAELTQALPGLCEQLEGRLHALEPFRALQQLTQREAGGKPVEAIASSQLRAHLDRELAVSQDYRVLRLLNALRDELASAPVADAVAPALSIVPLAPVAVQVTPTPAAFVPGTESGAEFAAAPKMAATSQPINAPLPALATAAAAPEIALSLPQWQTDDLHSEASQAVASVFGAVGPAVSGGLDASAPVAEIAALHPLAAKAEVREPPSVAAPPLPALPILVAHEPPRHAEIAEAEATVMAGLARLRAAEEKAATAAAAARAEPPAPPAPSTSMEGTMANVAAAVAATVAAAGRIAEPKRSGFPVSRPASPSPVVAPFAKTWRAAPTIAAMAEATEIRFVERAASPMLDIAPRAKPNPLADVPVAPIVALRPAVTTGDHAARDWEEAVVEIRRSGPERTPATDGLRADAAAAFAGRAGLAFGRFVKSLKGEKA